jgi:hypothetical protein
MKVRKGLLVKLATVVAALALVLTAQVTPASAATLQIQMSGLNLVYTDAGAPGAGTLCDATSCNGGGGFAADADPLITASFLVDGNLVGTLTSNIWVDMSLGVTNALLDNGAFTVTPTTGGIFDLITSAPGPGGWGLALNVGNGQLLFSDNLLSFTGIATVNSIFAQSLPFGLVIDQPIVLSYSANVTSFTTAGGIYTSFAAAGTPEVIGQAIPEPTSILLLGTGLAYAARQVRRRRASR